MGIFLTVSYLCVSGWVCVWVWGSISIPQIRVMCMVNMAKMNLFTLQMHWFVDSDKMTLNCSPTTESYLYRKQNTNANQDYKNRILEEKWVQFCFWNHPSCKVGQQNSSSFTAEIINEIFEPLTFLLQISLEVNSLNVQIEFLQDFI